MFNKKKIDRLESKLEYLKSDLKELEAKFNALLNFLNLYSTKQYQEEKYIIIETKKKVE